MSRITATPELPLLLAGVPRGLVARLRLAGVPAVRFRDGSDVARAVRRGSRQIVLFDARHASSRTDARTAQSLELATINVGAMLASRGRREFVTSAAADARRERRLEWTAVFDELKQAIEEVGGLWARVADVPSPYRTLALRCDGNGLDELGELAAAFASPPDACDAATWMQRRYQAGLPFAVAAAGTSSGGTGLAPAVFPLLWRASVEEFARWWRQREQIRVEIRKERTAYRIVCDDFRGAHRPMLELWRGTHVANIPLSPGELLLPHDGIAFGQEHYRHPAGFAAIHAADARRDELVGTCGQAAG